MDEARRQRRARFQRIEELFHHAAELDPAGRAALFEQECAGDPELKERVEALLAAGGEAEARIDGAVRSAIGMLDEGAAFNAGMPERIGPWRVIREIGRGGFSTVYLAERDDDQFRMKAAIKLVRQAGTEDVARRLRRERQILANLDHPNIARILDGGSTEAAHTLLATGGVPYVVMEYIEGRPIDAFCEDLDLPERLELFRQVCDAVQYAHGNLVLHRDIKPSNILVTDSGVPKLLDFGIAKVLDPDPATAETAIAGLANEPEIGQLARGRTLYAFGATQVSCDPQAAEEPLRQALEIFGQELGDEAEEVADTESLLAELWFNQGAYARAEELLREVLAKRRRIHGPDHPKVARSLNDLAAVAHANGNHPDAVAQFQRVLEMQRQSFGDRHGVVAGTLRNLATSTALLERTTAARSDGPTAVEMLEEAIGIFREIYGEGSTLEADCLHELGDLHRRAGDDEKAEELFNRALEVIRKAFGPDHPKLMRTHLALAKTVARDPARAEAVLRESVALRQRLLPEDDYRQSFPLVSLGRLLLDRGDAAAAEPLLRRAVENRRQGLPPGHWQIAAALTYLGQSLADQGKLAEAEQVFRASHNNLLANFGAQDRRTVEARARLTELRLRLGS